METRKGPTLNSDLDWPKENTQTIVHIKKQARSRKDCKSPHQRSNVFYLAITTVKEAEEIKKDMNTRLHEYTIHHECMIIRYEYKL